MKHIIGLLAMLLPILSGAQSPPVKALTIGDTVPDITITNVYNYSASTIHLSDLKGKLVILDFWATWCSGCIQELPVLDSLQKDFPDKVQILLISHEGAKTKAEGANRIKSFFSKWKEKNNGPVSLPSTLEMNDSLLKLFPHIFIPHYVWIAGNRKVIAITSSTEVNQQNIRAILNGSPVSMPLKSDKFPSHPQN
jgi:thiol-disulfide isomerase/thioredoxin